MTLDLYHHLHTHTRTQLLTFCGKTKQLQHFQMIYLTINIYDLIPFFLLLLLFSISISYAIAKHPLSGISYHQFQSKDKVEIKCNKICNNNWHIKLHPSEYKLERLHNNFKDSFWIRSQVVL